MSTVIFPGRGPNPGLLAETGTPAPSGAVRFIVEGEPGIFPDPIARLLVRLGRLARRRKAEPGPTPPPPPEVGTGDGHPPPPEDER